MRFSEWFLIIESKQSIVNLGFPEIISKFLYDKFGKLAPLIAKWYKQYFVPGERGENKNWWRLMHFVSSTKANLYELTYLYTSTFHPEDYKVAAAKVGLNIDDDNIDDDYLINMRYSLEKEIEEDFFESVFFRGFSLIRDIMNGKLKDIARYKRMPFLEAAESYDERNHLATEPIRTYPNGFKWIDTGKKSAFLAGQMRNCGSVGLMSADPDRTILTLFGPNNKPHVMVTYSPNQKRISGDQSAGSTPVKPEYHDYVIDLANYLGADFDTSQTKSNYLKLRYLLRNKASSVEGFGEDQWYPHRYFKFHVPSGVFYTDGYKVLSEPDLTKILQMIKDGELKLREFDRDEILNIFNPRNIETLSHLGFQVYSLNDFINS